MIAQRWSFVDGEEGRHSSTLCLRINRELAHGVFKRPPLLHELKRILHLACGCRLQDAQLDLRQEKRGIGGMHIGEHFRVADARLFVDTALGHPREIVIAPGHQPRLHLGRTIKAPGRSLPGPGAPAPPTHGTRCRVVTPLRGRNRRSH